MHQRRGEVVVLLLCSLFVALTAPSSSACTYSYSYDPKEVARDFSAEITDHGRGIANLHFQVGAVFPANNSKPGLMAFTDDHGTAWLRGVPPGAYALSIKNIALFPPEDVIVKRTPSEGALQKLALQLPDNDVLTISASIHGQMRTADPVNYQALIDFGGFSFSALPPGLYFLHVEAPAEPVTHRRALSEYIPITIDASAKVPNLEVYMSPGICVAFAYRNGDKAWSPDAKTH